MTLQVAPFSFEPDQMGGPGKDSDQPEAVARQTRGSSADAPVLGAFLTQALDLSAEAADMPTKTPVPVGAQTALTGAGMGVDLAGPAAASAQAEQGSASGTSAAVAATSVPGTSTADAVSSDFTPDDPLYADQWHFALLGDIETIWEEYSGEGVAVYVTDDGLEYTHEDLADNYDASMHFVYDGETYVPDPLSFSDAHGTACAGLIAAVEGNGVGGTGVAFGATLTGLDFLNTTQFEDLDLAMASLQWAENFDIMSNSWGITPGYSVIQSPFDTITANTQDDTVAVFELISSTGRDGLGTIVMQASGNDTMNAQGDAVNGTRFTTSIAATDEDGFATYYTNYGTNILITSPAAAVTTDLTGIRGYSRTDYADDFGGTSAATPWQPVSSP